MNRMIPKSFLAFFICFAGIGISHAQYQSYSYRRTYRQMISPSCSIIPESSISFNHEHPPTANTDHEVIPSLSSSPSPPPTTPAPRKTPSSKPNTSRNPRIPTFLQPFPASVTSEPKQFESKAPNRKPDTEKGTKESQVLTPNPILLNNFTPKLFCQLGMNLCPSPSPSMTPVKSPSPAPVKSQSPSPKPREMEEDTLKNNNIDEDDTASNAEDSNDNKDDQSDGNNSGGDDSTNQEPENKSNDENGEDQCADNPNEILVCDTPPSFVVNASNVAGCCSDMSQARSVCANFCEQSLGTADCQGVAAQNCPKTVTDSATGLCTDACNSMSDEVIFSLCTNGESAPISWDSLTVTHPNGDNCDKGACLNLQGTFTIANTLPIARDVEQIDIEIPQAISEEKECIDSHHCLTKCRSLFPDSNYRTNNGTHLSVNTCTRTQCEAEGQNECERACKAIKQTIGTYRDASVCEDCLADPIGQKCKVKLTAIKTTSFDTKTVECSLNIESLAPTGTKELLDFYIQQSFNSLR